MAATIPNEARTVANWPMIRCKDGTVILKLGPTSADWYLVDRKLFLSFGHMSVTLRPGWRRPKQLVYDGYTRDVYDLGLVATGGSFHLNRDAEFNLTEIDKGGRVVSGKLFMDSHSNMKLFDASQFIQQKQVAVASVNTWKAFIALLYDLPITLDQFMADPVFATTIDPDQYVFQAVTQVANVLALANFYECPERVAPALSSLLMSDKRIWKAMANEDAIAIFYPLSKALRCKDIYVDILFHVYRKAAILRSKGSYARYELLSLAQFLEVPVANLELQTDAVLKDRREAFEYLEQKLRNVTLVAVDAMPDHTGFKTMATNFANAASVSRQEVQHQSKVEMQAEQLSRSIWGQAITQRFDPAGGKIVKDLHSGGVVTQKIYSSSSDLRVHTIAYDIDRAITSNDSVASFFDHNIAHEYAILWTSDQDSEHELTKAIDGKLLERLHEAHTAIENWAVSKWSARMRLIGAPRSGVIKSDDLQLSSMEPEDMMYFYSESGRKFHNPFEMWKAEEQAPGGVIKLWKDPDMTNVTKEEAEPEWLAVLGFENAES